MSIGRWLGTGWALVRRASRPISRIALPSSSGLRPSFAVLLLLSATWLLALLSVNSDTLLFHYLFAACNCVQVPGPTLLSGKEHARGWVAWVCQPLLSLPARAPSSSFPTWCSARRSGKH